MSILWACGHIVFSAASAPFSLFTVLLCELPSAAFSVYLPVTFAAFCLFCYLKEHHHKFKHWTGYGPRSPKCSGICWMTIWLYFLFNWPEVNAMSIILDWMGLPSKFMTGESIWSVDWSRMHGWMMIVWRPLPGISESCLNFLLA